MSLLPPSRSRFSLFPRLVLKLTLAVLVVAAPLKSFAVSCVMQGEMSDDQRNDLLQSARKLALLVQSGNVNAVRASTIASVAAQFDSIADSVKRLAPMISGATITIDAMYLLNASDLQATQDRAEFFCASPDGSLQEVTIPQLPPGDYGLALVHATGVKQPQQLALILQKHGNWQLAGFFAKPLLVASYNGVWYWTKARDFARRGDQWDAHFYYQIAVYLASPVSFLNTPNMEKLQREQAAVKAEGLPGQMPAQLTANGQTYSITGLNTDDSLGGLDLVVHYRTADTSDPVATRSRNLALMHALLSQHPGLRQGFHGLWVFADAPGQRPFGIEQPMTEIQ